ncbi:tumor necrosis factor receptor superfamily member 4-like [Anomaloglossus baeobatrachus]|uniref:tumor necrosis factor receptor superfamily member 4-like n=1 Tax=Anomaloglossus baeobatrachus TaxID=238106 RepID=UPI003F500E2F
MEAAGMRGTGLLLLTLSALLPEPVTVCPAEQYPETYRGQDVCCNYCDSGQEISEICTPWNKVSKCKNCRENRFNEKNAREGCKLCTFCNKDEGSIEKKPCTKSSDAVCECPEGSTARNKRNTACLCDKGKEIVNNKCQPCLPGYFSSKENSFCQSWTNCSALGQNVLEPGSAMTDVKCSKSSNVVVTVPTTSMKPTSSSSRRKVSSLPNVTTSNHISIVNPTTTGKPLNWGTLSLILIGAILLIVSAGIILTMITQIHRKKKNRGFIRGERFRVPVQEESTSSDSSLPKNCPA